MLRLFLIGRLLRFSRLLILVALAAATVGVHGVAGNGRRLHHQAASVTRSLRQMAAPLRNRLEHALAVGVEPGAAR